MQNGERRQLILQEGNGVDAIKSQITNIFGENKSLQSFSTLYLEIKKLFDASPAKLKACLNEALSACLGQCYEELSKVSDVEIIPRFVSVYRGYQCIYAIVKGSCIGDLEILNSIQEIYKNTLKLENTENSLFETLFSQVEQVINSARSSDVLNNDNLNNISQIIEMYYNFDLKDQVNDKMDEGTEIFYSDFFGNMDINNFSEFLLKSIDQFNKEKSIFEKIMPGDYLYETFFNELFDDRSEKPRFLRGEQPSILKEFISLSQKPNLESKDTLPFKWLVKYYYQYRESSDVLNVCNVCAEYIKNKMLELKPRFVTPSQPSRVISQNISDLIILEESLSSVYLLLFEGINGAREKLDDEMSLALNNESFKICESLNTFLDVKGKEYMPGIEKLPREQFPSIIAKFYNLIINKRKFEEIYQKKMINRIIDQGLAVTYSESPLINEMRKPDNTSFLNTLNQYVNEIALSQKIEYNFAGKESRITPVIFKRGDFTQNLEDAVDVPTEISTYNQEFSSFYQSLNPTENLRLLNDLSQIILVLQYPTRANKMQKVRVITGLATGYLIQLIAQAPQNVADLLNEHGPLTQKRLDMLAGSYLFLIKDGKISINLDYLKQGRRSIKVSLKEPRRANT
ncbi:hypothetical protein M9Y10_022334 [Tritrichomonas musculus]|uniref:Cullin family profile domain-containing protein n=1 Tax=Tritrichomonas musculus TaxID=1915356 RepID=A0ABR2KS11_9EUKA